MNNSHQEKLDNMINSLLSGKLSVDDFRTTYYDYYLEEIPETELSDDEHTYYGMIQEKLDWVDDEADTESRSYGWINHIEYIEWLRAFKS